MIKPLFRWAGGKTKHIKYLKNHFYKTDTYVEPFFGGGAVFCYVYNNNLSSSFIINDIKKELIDLYITIQNNVENLINESQKFESAYLEKNKKDKKKYYYELREQYWNNPSSPLLYFLLKTCFNGVWQTCKKSNDLFGTPCGLLNEKEKFIDIENLNEWNIALQKTDIYNVDFEKIELPYNSLVYCDPPYRESFTSYGEGFDDDDQQRLVKWCNINSKNKTIILSNKSDNIFFEDLVRNIKNVKIDYFDATHTAGRRLRTKKSKENPNGFAAVKVKEIIIKWN